MLVSYSPLAIVRPAARARPVSRRDRGRLSIAHSATTKAGHRLGDFGEQIRGSPFPLHSLFGPHVSTRPPSAGEKQDFADFMNTLDDDERALNFRCMFRRTLDRDQLSALQADATFTVPLLDGMEVLQLNIWREMMRREEWEEIPSPAGEA